MAKNSIWCGYLEAGDKSSAVVLDQRLDTGNPSTIYLFNLARKEIIQYNRSIAEPKLRELKEEECSIVPELKTAYLRARLHFKVRTERPLHTPGRKAKPAQDRKSAESDDLYSASEAEFEPSVDEDWDEEENSD